MFAKLSYHQLLAARLRIDPSFAFDFARRFRDIPPIDPEDMMPMALISIERPTTAPEQFSFADVVIAAKVKPTAPPLPDRQPWPDLWGLLIDVIDARPGSDALLSWPLRYASLRAQLGCPVTYIVLVPDFAQAIRVNELFAIEPELTPVVVISDAMRNEGKWVN